MPTEIIYTVSTADADGAGSLQGRIAEAQSDFGDGTLSVEDGDFVTIQFASGISGDTIFLDDALSFFQSAETDIRINGDIDGDGIADITVSGDSNENGIADAGDTALLSNSHTTTFSNIDFQGGFRSESFAISILNRGDLTLDNVTISGSRNEATPGSSFGDTFAATIRNDGTLRLTDVVMEDNVAQGGDTSNDLTAGGLAVSGILNQSDLYVDNVSIDGTAIGGTGGEGQDGGDAVVGIQNDGTITMSSGQRLAVSSDLTQGGQGFINGLETTGIAGDTGGVQVGEAGTTGDDVIDRTDGNDHIGNFAMGLDGDDTMTANFSELLFGGRGNDLLTFVGGSGGEGVLLQGDDGEDTVLVNGSGLTAFGGQGGEGSVDDDIDTLDFSGMMEEITFDASIETNQIISESAQLFAFGFEKFIGSDLNDTLTGSRFQQSEIRGADGEDIITAGSMGDTMYGNADADDLFGSDGRDRAYGGQGADDIFGGNDNDIVYGGAGADGVNGGAGRDRVYGNDFNDSLTGGKGFDKVYGGGGKDTATGGSGNDSVFGGKGNDKLFGSSGRDSLFGGEGRDKLDGGVSKDKLFGGKGADDFLFGLGDNKDTIKDFNKGQNDEVKLDNQGLFSSRLSSQDVIDQFGTKINGDAALDFGDGDVLIFDGINNINSMADFIDIV